MNIYLPVICIYLCVTICSTGKITSKKMDDEVPGKTETDKQTEKKQTQTYHKRPSFKTKDDIPADYLEHLKKRYKISEDPLADRDRERQEYIEKLGYDPLAYDDYYYNYQDYEDHGEIKDNTDSDTDNDSTVVDDDDEESNKTCKACVLRDEAKAHRINTIKNTILNKIGFSNNNLPNMTGKDIPKIPSIQRLIEQHEMQGDAPYPPEDDYIPEDEVYGQVRKAYTIAQKIPEQFGVNIPGGSYFELPESVTSRRVQDASLWIYLNPEKHRQKEVYEIYLYIIQHKAKPRDILKGPVRYKKTTAEGWTEFKFAHIAHHWIKQPDANRGVIIHAFDSEGNNIVVTPDNEKEGKYFPMLEMSTVEHNDRHHRSKRYINNICSERDKRTTCCRYPLRVDFVEFGWDWVIAPTGYTANYCSGECLHRHVDQSPQAYLIQQAPAGSSPCCTAGKWYPLAMLYFDHAHTVLYTFMQKMIVDRCGCA